MKETLQSDRPIISYLLGESSAEVDAETERRYLSDQDFLAQVLAVEDELIDAYLRGGLTAHECERFESHFLASDDRRDKLETAEALLKYLKHSGGTEAAAATQTRAWKQSLYSLLRPGGGAAQVVYTCLILAVLGVLWLFVGGKWWRTPPQQTKVEQGRTEQQGEPEPGATAPVAQNTKLEQRTVPEKSAAGPSKQKLAPKPRPISVPVIASFVLTPGMTRDGGGTNNLVIPHSAQFVQLQLSLESSGSYKSDRASLQRVGGGEIWHGRVQDSRAGRGGMTSATLILPANLLHKGEYLLTVSGVTATGESEVVGDYPFTVSRIQNSPH